MTFQLLFALLATTLLPSASAAVTVYTAQAALPPMPTVTYNAFNDATVLTPPGVPANQNKQVAVQLWNGGMNGMSLPVPGSFLGFSIELSIATTLLGENAGILRPEFLNYCGIISQRAGAVAVRVGGNTQDTAVLAVNGNDNGKTLEKFKPTYSSTTETPDVHFTLDLLYVMKQISTLVNADWFFGIPFVFGDADGNASLIYQNIKQILGANLLGLQLANEPDLYWENGKKGPDYTQQQFMADTTDILGKLQITTPEVMGPSVCCYWSINDLITDGYITQFANVLKYVDVMHYPADNCARYSGNAVDPQSVFGQYLSHGRVQNVISPYFPVAGAAQASGKQLIMLETNTASCSGFPGVSNAFASSLWGVDYALQMAYGNFTYAMYHFGGTGAWYNPFTAPPTNMTKYSKKWTTGAIFYSHIVVAEALGKSGDAQVLDLQLDNNNDARAGYVVYEKGIASRVVLINYVSDPGNSDYTAVIGVGGGNSGQPAITPATVRVKYLLADSVSEKYNITWAGQNMGGVYESDGRLYGNLTVNTVNCDTQAGTCSINVPAPGVALVFLTDDAYQNSGGDETKTETFATTTTTGKHATRMTIDPAILATSNGRNGQVPLGTSSKNTQKSSKASTTMVSTASIVGVLSLLTGAFVLFA